MKKKIKIIGLITGIFAVVLWLLSSLFTEMTFNPEFEIHKDEHLAYQNVQASDCNATQQQSKDLTIKFSYTYPLVNFSGKLEIIDKKDTISNPEGKLLFSGKYKNKIILKNLCYTDKDQASLYKNLEFRFSDEDAAYWFYADTGKKGYPFLKQDKVTIKIDWFSIAESKPYQIIPLE
ncbi:MULTISPECIES: hypothetical protein [Aquimarina]|uniref:hypothetical protein n=1 Tax=Aquimarina TaxID=290174 RepID=UPI00041F144F|nr:MULTISPECIES: hypothetical protein [Aquimarina]